MTETVTLTAGYVTQLKPRDKRYYVRDSRQEGLNVVVQPTGSKAYYVVRKVNGKVHRVRLGDARKLTVKQARAKAIEAIRDLNRSAAPETVRVTDPATYSLQDLWPEFNQRHASKLKSDSVFRLWTRHIKGSSLWTRPMTSITVPDVVEFLESITEKSGPTQANRVRSALATGWKLARQWGRTEALNPVLEAPRNREKSRGRYLTETELKRLWTVLDAHQGETAADAVVMLLLTGSRRSSVMSLRWEELDLDAATWLIPGIKVKSGEDHTVPLVPEAIEVLKRRQADPMNGSTPWCFPASRGDGFVYDLHGAGWTDLLKEAKITGLRPHDLRRTCATWSYNAGAAESAVASWLGHKRQNVTGAVYALSNLARAREAAVIGTQAMLAHRSKK